MVTLTNTTTRGIFLPGVGVLGPGESCDMDTAPDEVQALGGAVDVTKAAAPRRRTTKEKP